MMDKTKHLAPFSPTRCLHWLMGSTDTRRQKIVQNSPQQGILEPKFYGGLIYKFRKFAGESKFLEHFIKHCNRYKINGYK